MEFWDLLVRGTNRYAEQVINSRMNNWKPTCVEEMKKFVGPLLLMVPGIMLKLANYWSTDKLHQTYFWSRVMSHDRFQLFLWFWCFVNNIECERVRLAKVQLLLDHLNTATLPGQKYSYNNKNLKSYI